MRNCYVPGCDRKNKMHGKRAMFMAPKDVTLFEKWAAVLPKLRPFKAGDNVCSLHFRPQDIQSVFEHKIGGQQYLLERERMRLKADAVPCKNLPTADELLLMQPSKRGRKTKTNDVSLIKATPNIPKKGRNVQPKTEIPCVQAQAIQDMPKEVEGNLLQLEEPLMTSNNYTAAVTSIEEATAHEVGFSNLYDDVFEVLLPNTMWGVHRCPQHTLIMFVCMDVAQLCATKMLTVDSSGSVNLYLVSRLIDTLTLPLDAHVTNTLSDLLEKLDNAQICVGADTNANCEVEVKYDPSRASTVQCNNCLGCSEAQ